MIYNRVRRKPLLRDYLSGGFLLWMHFVKHRELLRVEHIGVRHSKIVGMDSSTIYGMLPVEKRKAGVVLDASITNPDMASNYDSYIIENLQIPTLILHAKDDKLASYADVEKALYRFPNCTHISFETGGHLMVGHEEEVKKAVMEFITFSSRATRPKV